MEQRLVMRSIGRRLYRLGLAVAVLGAPQAAWACPQCAGNNGAGGAFWWILAGMILLPFPAVALVVFFVQRGQERERRLFSEPLYGEEA